MQKTVFLTGGTSGIGKATLLELLSKGYRVATCSPDKKSVAALSKELTTQFESSSFQILVGDVRHEDDIRTMVQTIKKAWKRIDILINNAGIGYFPTADAVNKQDMENLFAVNVFGPALLVKHVVPGMKKQKKGLIINIDSIAAKRVAPQGSLYSATKAAIFLYSEGIRKELRPWNIRVSTVCPGMVETKFFDKKEWQRRKKLWNNTIPPMLTAEDVARSVVFVCDQEDHVAINDLVVMHPQSE